VSKELIERLGKLPAEELLRLLETGTPDETRQAAIELGDRGEERAFGSLLSLLGGADPGVADGAALGIEALGDVRAVGPLLDAIEKRRRQNVHTSSLIWAVINLDPHQAVGQLEDLLRNGSYLEAHHATLGIRYAWDDLSIEVQEHIRASLQTCRYGDDIEDWRAEFIGEILDEGGWTPEQRAQWEDEA
jgi:HEAT repeat protein